jgi:hypothetical protein
MTTLVDFIRSVKMREVPHQPLSIGTYCRTTPATIGPGEQNSRPIEQGKQATQILIGLRVRRKYWRVGGGNFKVASISDLQRKKNWLRVLYGLLKKSKGSWKNSRIILFKFKSPASHFLTKALFQPYYF